MYKEMAILGHKEKVREDEIEVYKLKEIYLLAIFPGDEQMVTDVIKKVKVLANQA